MTSEAQKRAIEKYQKLNIRRVVLKLNKNTDQDIIAWLEGLKSVQGEVKKAIREYMKKE